MSISCKSAAEALRSARSLAALSTAVAAAAGALCAAVWACGGAPWYVAIALLLLFAAPQGWRRAAVMAGCAALVALSAGLQLSTAADFGTRPLYGTATIRAEDAGVSSLPELDGGRRTLSARLLSFTAEDGTISGRAAGGRVKAILPEGTALPVFGTVARVSGRLVPPGAAAAKFERPGRPTATLFAEDVAVVGNDPTWRGYFLELRDRMLGKLFSGVADPETRRLAAALFCGVVSGVPYEVRDRFSAAGMVHIFSVSGMHVAVLALSLGILLRFLPFRVRWPVLLVAVWGYVLVTGAGTPAVRAGAMVSLWCVLRMLLLKLPGFDILAWTLTLLLVLDPFLAASAGAQYSFLITGALLLLGSALNRRREETVGESDYLPACFRPRRRFRDFAASARYLLYGALTAFFASAPVSLHLPSAPLAPGSVLANVLLGVMMPGYFALFFVQLFAGLCGFGAAVAPLFEAAFALLRHLAGATAEFSPALVGPVPPWPVAAAYALALLAFLGSGTRRVRIAAAAFLALCIGCWLYLANGAPPAVLVVSSGYGRAASVAVADPVNRRAVLVNCPDRASAVAAAEFFRARGIAEVDVLGDAGGIRGIGSLNMRIRQVRDHRKSAAALRRAAAKRTIRAESARLHRDIYALSASKNVLALEYSDPGSKLCFGLKILDGDRGREISLDLRGRAVRATLPWSTDTESWKYEFDH